MLIITLLRELGDDVRTLHNKNRKLVRRIYRFFKKSVGSTSFRLASIANFFYVRSIESEHCMRDWLESSDNAKHLESIRGVGPKTVDYLKMLAGIPSVAVDRHIKTFVQRAGFKSGNYTSIRKVVEDAADQLRVHRTNLDYAIWTHVSQTRAPGLLRIS